MTQEMRRRGRTRRPWLRTLFSRSNCKALTVPNGSRRRAWSLCTCRRCGACSPDRAQQAPYIHAQTMPAGRSCDQHMVARIRSVAQGGLCRHTFHRPHTTSIQRPLSDPSRAPRTASAPMSRNVTPLPCGSSRSPQSARKQGRIMLNVGGRRYETFRSTLSKYPSTLLGALPPISSPILCIVCYCTHTARRT